MPWLGKKIDLRDVVAGLLNLQTYPSPIRAEYETEVLSHMPGWPPTKHKLKLTAVVFGAELAWDELRNDLIHFELPAGVRPNPPERPKSRRRGRERQSVPAPDREIHQAIAETYDHADAIGEKPPNVNEVIKPVQARLSTRYHASGRRIRELAGDPRYDRRRWTPGMTRSSKKRKVDR